MEETDRYYEILLCPNGKYHDLLIPLYMIYEPRAKYITNTEIANPDFIFSTIDVILVNNE